MADNRKQVEEIVQALGGAENIEAATHCVTRLRFALADEKKVDRKRLEQIDLVQGHFYTQGQFQVVIGPGLVDKIYAELIEVTGGRQASKDDVKKLAGQKTNPLQRAIKTLADIFIPILPAIVTAGLLMGINNILTGSGIFYDEMSLVEVYPAWTDLAAIIDLIANTAFTFLPALIGWSAAVRFGGSPLLGIVLGLILVHPDLLNAWSYANASAEGTIPVWNLFGWEIEAIGYQGQVLPVLVSAYVLAKIEGFLNRKVPDSVKLLVVAPVALLVTGFLAFTLIGPVTFAVGNAITSGVVYLFETFPAIGGLVYGGLYALLVVTGMHHTFLAVDVQLVSNENGTFLWPMLALSNIAQGAAALAMFWVVRDQKTKGLSSTSAVSAFLGVTEPAIFGVNIRYKYPFLFGMLGSAIAGILLTLNNVLANSIGVGGIPGFLSIYPNQWTIFFIGMAIVLIVPFGLTLLYGKTFARQKAAAEAEEPAETPAEPVDPQPAPAHGSAEAAAAAPGAADVLDVRSPLNGRALPLSEVPDPAFAEGAMGEGVAIEPEEGKVFAPFDAKVAHLIKSKHAVILEHATGAQMLIHVGINTVSLKGEPFTSHVSTGDEVKAGQLLLEFDMEAIRAAGLPLITPLIVPAGQDIIEGVAGADEGAVTKDRSVVLRLKLNG